MSTRTRLNAKRDSFTGQVTTLSDADRPAFEELTFRMLIALQPITELETFLAHAIAWDNWRLNNLRAIEMNMYAVGAGNSTIVVERGNPALRTAMAATATFAAEARNLAVMSLCEQRLNRSLHKNLATLRELQAERRLTEASGQIGFAFANNKIPPASDGLTTFAAAKDAA